MSKSPCRASVSATSHSLMPAPIALIAPLSRRFDQRLVAAFHEFADARVGGVLAAMGENVDVMGVDDVDVIEAEPLERELERAHHAVIGIVEHLAARRRFEKRLRRAISPPAGTIAAGGRSWSNQIGVARLGAQETIEPGLGETEAVKRRGIVIASSPRSRTRRASRALPSRSADDRGCRAARRRSRVR